MLCEKCGRRQAEWGTLCNECEALGAMKDRKAEVAKSFGRLKGLALWMAAEFIALALVCVLVGNVLPEARILTAILAVMMLMCVGVAVVEWRYWHGYAARLEKGEWQQVAHDLLHRPKGFWKHELYRRDSVLHHRRQKGLALLAYVYELRGLYDNRAVLEALAKTEK